MILAMQSSSSLPSTIATSTASSTASSCYSILRHLPHRCPARFVKCPPLLACFHSPIQATSSCFSPLQPLSISRSRFGPAFRKAWARGSSSITGIRVTDLSFMGCSSFEVGEAKQAKQAGRMDGVGSNAPVLLFDVMGTIVRDPFYEDVPAFFGISMKELMASKHPTAWVEFEKGLITEEELIYKFFSDQRDFDSSGLKNCMACGYTYLEGVEALLDRLKSSGYQMHAFTNYPLWYKMIEEKLKLSKYLTWTFVSCHTGKRKPDRDAYIEAANQLELSPSDLIFIDDQSRNVEAATQIGMTGLAFQDAKKLEKDLLSLGMDF